MKLPDAHVTVRVTKVVRTTVSPRRALWVALAIFNLCSFVSYVAQGKDWGQVLSAAAVAFMVYVAATEDR